MDAIWDGDIKIDESLAMLSDEVSRKAEKDAVVLLEKIKLAVDLGSKGLLRIKWGRVKEGKWEITGTLHMPKGPGKRLAWIGMVIGHGPRAGQIFGWVYPKGGLDGRRYFARKCNLKKFGVHLVSDYTDKYTGWDDCVIWLKAGLTLKTSRDELDDEIKERTTRFFKIAKPLMSALHNGRVDED